MRKEFYKLIIVFIMITLAFSIAFFLGREITLTEQNIQKEVGLREKVQARNQNTEKLRNAINTSQVKKTKQSQIIEYKKRIQSSEDIEQKLNIEQKSDIKQKPNIEQINKREEKRQRRKQKAKKRGRKKEALKSYAQRKKVKRIEDNNLKGSQNTSSKSLRKKISFYGLMVASYKEKKMAMDKSTDLKIRFSTWNIFFKRSKKLYKVYIGPFMKKSSAEEFLENIKNQKEFTSARLEKLGTKRKNKNKK